MGGALVRTRWSPLTTRRSAAGLSADVQRGLAVPVRPRSFRRRPLGPDVGQAEFNPYADPGRAAREEFGDVLGEGLYHLLHAALPMEVARHGHYWHSVHRKRGKLLARLIEEARARADRVDDPAQRCCSTGRRSWPSARSRVEHRRATPEALADFVRRWCHDEETWRHFGGASRGTAADVKAALSASGCTSHGW